MPETPVPEEVESAADKSLRGHLDLDLYTTPDLCARLDVHPLTVRKAARNGDLRAVKFGQPAGLHFFHEDVIEWLDSLQTRPRTHSKGKGLLIRLR